MVILKDMPKLLAAYASLAEPKPEFHEFADWWIQTEKVRQAVRFSLQKYEEHNNEVLLLHPIIGDLNFMVERFFLTPEQAALSKYRQYPSLLTHHEPVDFEA